MTESEVTTVETQLGVLLPGHYRRFLLAYPRRLIDAKLDLGWGQEAPADRKLYNNAEQLMELNRYVRLPGAPWVGEAGDPWPDNYFIIGEDQCGNYWCVDLLSADSAVWFYDHELGAFERQHGGLHEFGESLLKDITWFNQRKAKETP